MEKVQFTNPEMMFDERTKIPCIGINLAVQSMFLAIHYHLMRRPVNKSQSGKYVVDIHKYKYHCHSQTQYQVQLMVWLFVTFAKEAIQNKKDT